MVLAGEHGGDRLIVVVGGQAAQELDRLFRGALAVGLSLAA